jgi:uncharacterized protein
MLKKSIVLVALAALLLTGCGAGAAIASYNPAGTGLTVSGHGEVRLEPDVAYITIGVHSEGSNISQVVAANADQVAGVMQALMDAGVAQADIQTSNFSVYTGQSYDPVTGQPSGTNYSVDNQVNVTARDLTSLGALLDSAVSAGANNIWGVTFDLADKTEAQGQARDMAVQDAKDEASALASAAGVSLSDIVTVSYTPTTYYYGPNYGMGGGGGAESATTSIVPGLITVSADVTITYGLN